MNQYDLQQALRFEKPTLVGMRGAPGSGKSHRARELLTKHGGRVVIHATDSYFYQDGVYRFDVRMAYAYHMRNQEAALESMTSGIQIVIIDNTNIFADHFYPYYEFARELGYTVLVLEPTAPWAFDLKELARRNTHQMPPDAIEAMLKRYESPRVFQSRLEELWEQNQARRQPFLAPLGPGSIGERTTTG